MGNALSLDHLNDNQLAAVSILVTNPDPDYGELVEVAILPVDCFQVSKTTTMFTTGMLPDYEIKKESITPKGAVAKVERALQFAVSQETAAQLFDVWFDNLKLLYDKRIMPLAYNWPLVSQFLIKWLGRDVFEERFDYRYRDVLPVSLFLDDKSWINGLRVPFQKQDLKYLQVDAKIKAFECENTATEAKHIIDLYRFQRDLFLGL